MGSIMDAEYMTNFLDLFRYVPYLEYAKAKFEQIFSEFPIEFRDWIEYDEAYTLEEFIEKLQHFYE